MEGEQPTPDRIELGSCDLVAPGSMKAFQVDEQEFVLVVNHGGEFHAINNVCPHRKASLSQGTLEGSVVTCPWHGWQFDAATGRGITNPFSSARKYVLHVESGKLILSR